MTWLQKGKLNQTQDVGFLSHQIHIPEGSIISLLTMPSMPSLSVALIIRSTWDLKRRE